MADRVLIVEDDEKIRSIIETELGHEGFEVRTAGDGRQALEEFAKEEPSIVLLDIMLPGLSGIEVLRRIRKASPVPVILITARSETYDKVNGLDAGADDYIPKPFEIEELLARMRAVMRRSKGERPALLKVRQLQLNPDSMKVHLNGSRVELSRTEYLLLKFLMEHADSVMSRDEIISAVWGDEHFIEDNAVDVYIRYLRTKIDRKAGEDYIVTVRGAGYMLKGEE